MSLVGNSCGIDLSKGAESAGFPRTKRESFALLSDRHIFAAKQVSPPPASPCPGLAALAQFCFAGLLLLL
jgi:hypothetical protein